MLLVIVAAWAPLAAARDVDIKVHDMQSVVTGAVHVEIVGPGGRSEFEPRDDGSAPDNMANDHMYTAHGDVAADNGQVVVTAAGRTWKGGFAFDAQSDPVLLIGLQPDGLAGASTREVMFVPEPPMMEAPRQPELTGSGPKSTRTTLPDGMWAGWILGALALAGLGGLAWWGGRSTARRVG